MNSPIHNPKPSAVRIRLGGHRGLLLLAVLAALTGGMFAAEGPIAAVQNALIREQYLQGDASGVLDEATRGALRRFQIRHSLPPTGEIDTATLQALQREETPGQPAASIDRQGPAPAVVASDREFLQRVESAGPPTAAPVAPAPVAVHPPTSAPVEPSTTAAPPDFRPAAPEPQAAPVPRVAPREPTVAVSKPVPQKRESSPRKGEERPKSKATVAASREEVPVVKKSESSRRKRDAETEVRRAEPVVRAEDAGDPDVLAPNGVRIIRSTTSTTKPDGRTYIYEKTTTTYSGTPAPTLRGSTAVESHRKSGSFFDRIFGDD
jgi:peptidoglycan hydrolase-like protein with peptidoglycan-binding domain